MNQYIEHLKDIIEILSILGIVIEVTPIKISPLKLIGNRFNKNILDKLSKVDERVKELEERELKRDLESKRSEVLKFADDLRRGKRTTVERFDHIIDVMDEYHKLIHDYNIENGKFEVQRMYIIEMYKQFAKDGKFKEKIKSGDLL